MAYPKPADYPPWLRLLVVSTLALFAINLFFFLGPLSALLTAISPMVTTRSLLGGAGTLAATFIGAWLAFKFATFKAEKERVKNEVAAGNRALFMLTWMWNEIKHHQTEVVDPHRGKPDVWLNLRVAPPLNETLSLSMSELSFVMETNAPVFQRVFLEQERFRRACHLVNEHRRVALTLAWPKLEAAGIQLGEERPESEMQKIIGTATVQQLKVVTGALINNLDENLITLRTAFVDLRAELKKIYPNKKFVNFRF